MCRVTGSAIHGLTFFFNAPATTVIYTLSLHDALPISLAIAAIFFLRHSIQQGWLSAPVRMAIGILTGTGLLVLRSEEHTSELQSLAYLVCRLLLEKKKIQALLSSPGEISG